MSDLAELLEKVKAATGPDRWLSRDVWQALDTAEWKRAYIRAQEPCGCPHDQAVEYAERYLPDVTTSIDAAVALCERLLPGWKASHGEFSWSFGFQDERVWTCKLRYYRTKAHAPTLPLAILAGLLQALISQEQK